MNKYLSLIKFSHTIFAMPFALCGFTLGYVDHAPIPYIMPLILVVFCMVFGRSAAMAFNRWLDRDIDAKNPRTVIREIPAGIISQRAALFFVIANAGLFVVCTYFINTLCFLLSPVALSVILGYSYTKRFTSWCHLILGLGLSLAPIGAYLAVAGHFSLIPLLLSATVLFWVAGFDVIYALQDETFDRQQALFSIPVLFGAKRALYIARLLHLLCAILLTIALWFMVQSYLQIGMLAMLAWLFFIGLLVYQHSIVKVQDFSRINLAFFTTNGVASVVFGTLLILDLLQ